MSKGDSELSTTSAYILEPLKLSAVSVSEPGGVFTVSDASSETEKSLWEVGDPVPGSEVITRYLFPLDEALRAGVV